MPEHGDSSLDRLVRTRGPLLLGVATGMGGSRAWSLAGALQVVAGGAALGAAGFYEVYGLLFVGVWASLQGLFYLNAARGTKKSEPSAGVAQARLTREAEALLR